MCVSVCLFVYFYTVACLLFSICVLTNIGEINFILNVNSKLLLRNDLHYVGTDVNLYSLSEKCVLEKGGGGKYPALGRDDDQADHALHSRDLRKRFIKMRTISLNTCGRVGLYVDSIVLFGRITYWTAMPFDAFHSDGSGQPVCPQRD